MSVAVRRSPYPGLRSFLHDDANLFFGRDALLRDILGRLTTTRFLALVGAAGSGKTSLLQAGLVPALERGALTGAGSHWRIADLRPAARPLRSLAEALLRTASPSTPTEEQITPLCEALALGPRSLVDWCTPDNLPEGTNLLLIVDPFEELFGDGVDDQREEQLALAALLTESARVPATEARVYVAIAMRHESISSAARLATLATAINNGFMLVPRMTRDEVRDAIVEPARACDVSIEPALAERVVEDFVSLAGADLSLDDDLIILQHALGRLWSIAELRSVDTRIELTLSDYESIGGLRGAMADHAGEILDALLPEHQAVASAVFRALVTGANVAEAVSRPISFGDLVEIAGDEVAVREAVESFRGPGRSFLLPSRPTPLNAATVIEIGEESLIREWGDIAAWLDRENAAAELWRRLVEAVERYERHEGDLLSGPKLAAIAEWWDTDHPNAAWARRYGGDFDLASDFLAESRDAEAARSGIWAGGRRRKSRNRYLPLAAAIAFCIITPLTAFAVHFAVRAGNEASAAREAREEARASDLAARESAEGERLAHEAVRRAESEAAEANRLAEIAAAEAEAERDRAAWAAQEAAKHVATAEAERQRADAEHRRAQAAQQEAIQAALAADSEQQRANEQRARALAAERQAEAQAAVADAERRRADQEHTRLVAARQEIGRQLAAAESERKRAEEGQTRALAAQAEAERQAANAEAERKRAEQESARALAAEQAAKEETALAESERQRADAADRRANEEHARALVAQEEAGKQAQLAESEGRRADEARLRALALQQEATQAADRAEQALAETERANVLVQSLRTEIARLRAINPAMQDPSPTEEAEIDVGRRADPEIGGEPARGMR